MSLKINFIGNFDTPNMVGEVTDETHLARELQKLGHQVNTIQRDEWKAQTDGRTDPKWKKPIQADINIVAKWQYFSDGNYIRHLRAVSGGAPVFYWVWDFMFNNGFPDWHIKMAQAADLYLSGEQGIASSYFNLGVNFYYFQMDVCDGNLPVFQEEKIHDVIFTGSCIDQGHRKEWLPIINKAVPVKVWAFNPEEWQKLGIEAYPAVYGSDYNKLIAQSKIVLGFNVEPNCWGYWSNRVGKVLKAGGFLLQEYAPGMEQYLPEGAVKYFSSPEEAIELILYYLTSNEHINKKCEVAQKLGYQFTSSYRVRRLDTLMERYLKGNPKKWNKLPTI